MLLIFFSSFSSLTSSSFLSWFTLFSPFLICSISDNNCSFSFSVSRYDKINAFFIYRKSKISEYFSVSSCKYSFLCSPNSTHSNNTDAGRPCLSRILNKNSMTFFRVSLLICSLFSKYFLMIRYNVGISNCDKRSLFK